MFRKSAEKIQIWLECYKYDGYFTRRPKYIYDISLNSSQNKKYFRQKLYRKSKHNLYSITLLESRVLCMLDNEGYKHNLRMCGT